LTAGRREGGGRSPSTPAACRPRPSPAAA
jgi:hypothetical protein